MNGCPSWHTTDGMNHSSLVIHIAQIYNQESMLTTRHPVTPVLMCCVHWNSKVNMVVVMYKLFNWFSRLQYALPLSYRRFLRARSLYCRLWQLLALLTSCPSNTLSSLVPLDWSTNTLFKSDKQLWYTGHLCSLCWQHWSSYFVTASILLLTNA